VPKLLKSNNPTSSHNQKRPKCFFETQCTTNTTTTTHTPHTNV